MWGIKNTVKEMDIAFGGLVNRLRKSKERIVELEDMANRNFPNWNAVRKKNKGKKHQKYLRTCNLIEKCHYELNRQLFY